MDGQIILVVFALLWLGHSVSMLVLSSECGHISMEYQIYSLLPPCHAIELAFEVVYFYFEVFVFQCFTLLDIYCVYVESVAIIFVGVR